MHGGARSAYVKLSYMSGICHSQLGGTSRVTVDQSLREFANSALFKLNSCSLLLMGRGYQLGALIHDLN